MANWNIGHFSLHPRLRTSCAGVSLLYVLANTLWLARQMTADASEKSVTSKGWPISQEGRGSSRTKKSKGVFMKNTQNGLSSNFYNKSQLIREVSRARPGMTNKQIKKSFVTDSGLMSQAIS
jgi:hypothetical protein